MNDDSDPIPAAARLRRGLVLRTAEGTSARVLAGGAVEVVVAGQRLRGRSELLAALEVFSTGCPLQAGIASYGKRAVGGRDLMGFTAAVMALERLGALVPEGTGEATLGRGSRDFDDPVFHIEMLDDRVRTERFIAGVRATVRPGDVVLDIGTGTGVLAVAAAQAGARRVHAIDVGNIAAAARAVAECNGMDGRIEVIHAWSARVELPERCDVLVGEIMGNEPFAEGVLESFLDARKRLLKPGATVLPSRVRVYGRLVRVAAERVAQLRFGDAAARRWQAWYDIDLSALTRFNAATSVCYLPAAQAAELEVLSAPALLAEVDLATFECTSVRSSGTARATASGSCNAVLVTFELELSPGVVCSSAPAEAGEAAHWLLPAWIFDPPLPVAAGDAVEIEYARNDAIASDGAHVTRRTRAAP